MLDFAAKFSEGLSYDAFLDQHGSDADRAKWAAALEQVTLTPEQTALVESFVREMPVICLAGAWCGDCVSQCPILHKIALANDRIKLRFFDRDEHPDLGEELQICGAARVPSVLFVAEDFAPTGRYGDKTLAKYRKLAGELSGAACSIGANEPGDLRAAVIAEWVEQFERNQLILRTSGRLRKKHGD
ncbi:thioredoxin family protein [Alienimonas sp. DA493]|uniref:thioredoxin family protein n=1 Tax=Alienimonas sp. DA493 TaxID=3373605 RepID=UPI003754BA88